MVRMDQTTATRRTRWPHARRRQRRRERRSAPAPTMRGMTAPTVAEILAGAARAAEAALAGHNLRLTATGRVHAVGQVRWIGGVTAPGPLCHIGTTSGPVAGIIPTPAGITCARCLATLGCSAEQPPLAGLEALEGALAT